MFVFFVFVFFWFKPDQTPQMVHSTISWPQVFVLFWDFVLILSRLLWECLHILLLVSIGVLIWLQIYKFFEVRDYKFLQEPENFITNFNILELKSNTLYLDLAQEIGGTCNLKPPKQILIRNQISLLPILEEHVDILNEDHNKFYFLVSMK